MIKALVDTNVVLDALASREPFKHEAEKIFLLAAEDKFQPLITASSVTDIYYLLRKNLSEEASRNALQNLFQLFGIITISRDDCEAALESALPDYEDALLSVSARKAKLDCIISRDQDFLRQDAGIAVLTPAAFLKQQ